MLFLPYALSLTPSIVQKTINSHSTLHSRYSCHASVTTAGIVRVFSIYSLHPAIYKQLGRYESLHIMKLLSVQCLQIDDVIPILSPAVYCGFGRCGFTWWHYDVTEWIKEPDCDHVVWL